MKFSKSGLAVELSKLQTFKQPNVRLEQYPTDSEIAAHMIWTAHLKGEIEDKIIADFGCGTGILGIGALLLGAKKVFFIDIDKKALEVLSKNLEDFKEECYSILNLNIEQFSEKVDLIIQNPPFGTREKHSDKAFLKKAIELTNTIYSFHKTTTSKFIEGLMSRNGFSTTERWQFDFPIKQTQKFHKTSIKRIKVTCFRFQKETTGPE